MSFLRMSWLVLFVVIIGVSPCIHAGEFALRDGDMVVFLGDSLADVREIYRELQVAAVSESKGTVHQRGVRWRHGRRWIEAVVARCVRSQGDGAGGRVWDQRYRLGRVRRRGAQTKISRRGAWDRNGVPRARCASLSVFGGGHGSGPGEERRRFSEKMCDEGMALSNSLGGEAIDVQRSMREVQKRVAYWNEKVNTKDDAKKDSLHVADGVHLNDLGQLAMTFSILKGLGAQADVSSATLNFAEAKVVAADECEVSKVSRDDERFEFTRLDEGLPFNHGIFFAVHYRFVPVPAELNRYLLSVKNLPAGKYDVSADDRAVGSFTAAQLSEGVNIASTTANAWQSDGPWNAQADALVHLTNSRSELAVANLLGRLHLSNNSLVDELATATQPTNERLEELQRLIAKPRPYRFVVQPAKPSEKAK